MLQIGITRAKRRWFDIVDMANKGETIAIMRRTKEVARLCPPGKKNRSKKQKPAQVIY